MGRGRLWINGKLWSWNEGVGKLKNVEGREWVREEIAPIPEANPSATTATSQTPVPASGADTTGDGTGKRGGSGGAAFREKNGQNLERMEESI